MKQLLYAKELLNIFYTVVCIVGVSYLYFFSPFEKRSLSRVPKVSRGINFLACKPGNIGQYTKSKKEQNDASNALHRGVKKPLDFDKICKC